MFKPKVTVDLRSFDRAMKEYRKASNKTNAEIVNQKGLWIAINALNMTIKATASKIRSELRSKRKGGTLASFIINKRRADAGKPGLKKKALA